MASREQRDREIASWAQMRGADRNDMTPAQRQRFDLWIEIDCDESLGRWLIKEREKRQADRAAGVGR